MPDGTIPDTRRDGYVTRDEALHVKAIREGAREADFVASTDTIDRHGEVVDQATWKLDAFKANPVILYGHQSYELPIGQAIRCEVVKGQLECTIRFASAEGNPKADQIWRLVQEKVLRAVSVGFRPMDGKYEIRDGEEVFVWYGNELREISVVAMPANPDALAKMKSDARDKTKSVGNEPAPTDPQQTSPRDGAEEILMDAKEMQAKIDALTLEKAEAKLAEKTALEKATELDAKLKTLETENAALKSAKDTLAKEHDKACTDRDAATKRADEAETKLIEVEVDGIIGKKIAPTEKDDFLKLRKDSPDLFKSMVAKRPDMKLTEPVTGNDTKAATALGNAGLNGDASATLFNKL